MKSQILTLNSVVKMTKKAETNVTEETKSRYAIDETIIINDYVSIAEKLFNSS